MYRFSMLKHLAIVYTTKMYTYGFHYAKKTTTNMEQVVTQATVFWSVKTFRLVYNQKRFYRISCLIFCLKIGGNMFPSQIVCTYLTK